MRIVESRRIRGPSLGATGPGAIVEVAFEPGDDEKRALRSVRASIRKIATYVGKSSMGSGARVRTYAGGLALFVPASIDLLEPAVDMADWAIEFASARLERTRPRMNALLARIPALKRELARHRDRRLPTLEAAARRHGLPFLFDDERVTIGHAATSVSHPLGRIPAPGGVPWKKLAAIRVALVTGTNGKTTTTRLVAHMAKCAGLVPGYTSSDGTAIDETIVEAGDNTGGESARAVLRDPRVQIAILETARGGLLRRGLALTNVDAALLTNVSADHLGEHGVLDVDALIATKAVVGHAVRKGGKVVLGADDPGLRRIARTFAAERVLFAIELGHVRAHVARGGHAFVLDEGALVHVHGRVRTVLVRVDEVPITSGGTAVHNVKNALAAAALAWSLGLPDDAVIAGLRSFDAARNPGRGQVIAQGGARVLLDFGHNPAAAAELYAWAHVLAGERRVHAVITQPGDRDDAAMRAFVRAIAETGVASVGVWETASLLRGRAAGDIASRLVKEARAAGLSRVSRARDEASAIRAALKRAKKGDVVVVSPSLDRALPAHG